MEQLDELVVQNHIRFLAEVAMREAVSDLLPGKPRIYQPEVMMGLLEAVSDDWLMVQVHPQIINFGHRVKDGAALRKILFDSYAAEIAAINKKRDPLDSIHDEDRWEAELDQLVGPFASADEIEAHLASAPPGSQIVAYARGVLAGLRRPLL